MCIYIYIYICVCICIYICICYIYIYTFILYWVLHIHHIFICIYTYDYIMYISDLGRVDRLDEVTETCQDSVTPKGAVNREPSLRLLGGQASQSQFCFKCLDMFIILMPIRHAISRCVHHTYVYIYIYINMPIYIIHCTFYAMIYSYIQILYYGSG